MNIDVYSTSGTKKGTKSLPAELFGVDVNEGLIHQALVRQQNNRRASTAHVKTRGEVQGSTRKLFQQKGTGRARRGSVRSPVLRGGGKAFGPRNKANYVTDMPKKMRRKALACCLSMQAKAGIIFGIENFSNEHKTKQFIALLQKLPVELGRRITIVVPAKHEALQLAARNVPRVRVIIADYLNPEDILQARHLIFVSDAIDRAVELFVDSQESSAKSQAPKAEPKTEAKKAPAKTTAKKPATSATAKATADKKKAPTKKSTSSSTKSTK